VSDLSRVSKDDLRAKALARRDALSAAARKAAAEAVAATPLPVELPAGTIVAGYSPIGSELDPLRCCRRWLREARRWRCRW